MSGNLVKYLLAILLCACAAPAWCQSTVGEVTGKGGARLPVEELKALLPEATISGLLPAGGQYSFTLKSDGSLSGNSSSGYRATAALSGKWRVADDGKWCTEITNNTNHNTESRCLFMFKLGDKYFSAGSEAPETAVFARNIRK